MLCVSGGKINKYRKYSLPYCKASKPTDAKLINTAYNFFNYFRANKI